MYCSDYPVDCACNQGMSCQVMRANFTIVNRMQLGRFLPVNDENHPYVILHTHTMYNVCIHIHGHMCTWSEYNLELLVMKMTIGVEAVLDPVRVCNNLHLHNCYNSVTGGTETPLTASHLLLPPAHCPLCFQRSAPPITHPAYYHITHRVTLLIQMMTVY